MKTITISEGITLTASKAVIDAYGREVREAEWERETIEWLNTHDITDPDYSDIFKDIYGIRPRW